MLDIHRVFSCKLFGYQFKNVEILLVDLARKKLQFAAMRDFPVMLLDSFTNKLYMNMAQKQGCFLILYLSWMAPVHHSYCPSHTQGAFCNILDTSPHLPVRNKTVLLNRIDQKSSCDIFSKVSESRNARPDRETNNFKEGYSYPEKVIPLLFEWYNTKQCS